MVLCPQIPPLKWATGGLGDPQLSKQAMGCSSDFLEHDSSKSWQHVEVSSGGVVFVVWSRIAVDGMSPSKLALPNRIGLQHSHQNKP